MLSKIVLNFFVGLSVMGNRCIVAALAITLGLLTSISGPPAARNDGANAAAAEAAVRRATDPAVFQAAADDDGEAVPVLWEEPDDLEKRDLFWGIGGKKGAPDPDGTNTFVGRQLTGTSEKIKVVDDKKRKWTVKFGEEARPETTATRIVWAVGYHVDEAYFVKRTFIHRGRNGFEVENVRFERDDDGYKKVGRWDWNKNPFAGTRELDGLKTLMAVLNNFDVKTENNKVIRPGKKKGDRSLNIYFVTDLGATLGSTGNFLTGLPILGELPMGSKGNAKQFAEHDFIDGVRDGEVLFHIKRRRAARPLMGVKVEHARWMGELLARVSDKQLGDAFRAGGFDEAETAVFIQALRSRIRQLRELR